VDVRLDHGFGGRLRLMRLARDLSQAELARSIGRHQTAIGPYERGEYMPARDVVEKLADILGTSPEYLLFGRTPHQTQIPIMGRIGEDGVQDANEANETIPFLLLDDWRLGAFRIADASMAPAFPAGFIALVQQSDETDMAALIGQFAIVDLLDGRRFLRRLSPAAEADCFDLCALNGPTWPNVRLSRAQRVLGCLAPAAFRMSPNSKS